MTSIKPTIVIVHGAWSDSSPFAAVDSLLAADGYTVAHFANPLRSLDADTDYLAAFLETRTAGPVVLVGHSYGGAVIGGAALSEPAGEQAWKTLPSWYVAGTEDHSIDIDTQRFMAERAGSTLTEVKAGHLAMVAEPGTVTRIIEDAAAAK